MLMQCSKTARRGVTALLAMIFLVLFATLAVGFYASTNQTAVISTNEKNGTISLTAAESGMDFIRYQLALIKCRRRCRRISISHTRPITWKPPWKARAIWGPKASR